ncbi:MAG: hypothetical protein K2Y56_25110 [Methylobacterium sp.]|uniref:hypothetical protein n=1 Tax=Methylobacterium sp. TaxID=409 RepID=UPI0025D31EEF|nr:hypothetical protein [Methylobacterium sp.]MBX9934751.1 hypothetical protein [Methylobacterium sp.]
MELICSSMLLHFGNRDLKGEHRMMVDHLNQDELNELLDLYRSTPGNHSLQFGADRFHDRCEASVNGEQAQIYVSDQFCGRDVSVAPRVFTFKVRFPENDEDTIVGCATAFDARIDGLVIEDLSLIDLMFADEMHKNSIRGELLTVSFVKELISVVYRTFMPKHFMGVYFFDDCDESERTGNILQQCHFRKEAQPSERLVFVQPPHDDPVPNGGNRFIRPIARYVLDVQRAIDSREGTLREFLLNPPNKR